MGSGASTTHVKEIRIDQNDTKWDRRKRNSRKSSISQGLGQLKEKLRSSSASSKSSDLQLDRMKVALESAEKRSVDSEKRCRVLEKDLSTLELRNNELHQEVQWLRQQIPENPLTVSQPRPKTSTSWPTAHRASLDDQCSSGYDSSEKQNTETGKFDATKISHLQRQISAYEEEIAGTKAAFQQERQKLLHEMMQLKQNSQLTVDSLKKQLQQLTQLVQKYQHVTSPDSDNTIASSAATRSIPHLQQDIEIQERRIQSLVEALSSKEKELVRLRECIGCSAEEEAALSKSMRSQRRLVLQSNDLVKSDIDDILDSAKPQCAPKYGVPNSRGKSKRIISAAKLKNVYALSDKLEPMKVMETPVGSMVSLRPSTADSVAGGNRMPEPKEQTITEEECETNDSSLHRNNSAPMLFKPRTDTSSGSEPKNSELNQNCADKTEVMSIFESDDRVPPKPGPVRKLSEVVEESDSEPSVTKSATQSRSSSAARKARQGSISISPAILKETAKKGSLDDESDDELKKLFCGSDEKDEKDSNADIPTESAATLVRQRSRATTASAKSRDSGFLGDSVGSLASNLIKGASRPEKDVTSNE